LNVKQRLAVFENLLLKQCILDTPRISAKLQPKRLKQHFDCGGSGPLGPLLATPLVNGALQLN